MRSVSKLLTLSFFMFLLFSFPWVGAIGEDTAASELSIAEETLTSAYESVLDAEKAGANITGLLDTLNVGGEYLAKAYVWYRLGDYENTSYFAGLCREVVDDVSGDAIRLREEAERLGEADFFMQLIVSAVGVSVLLTVGFMVWSVFKRRYNKRILGLKPEVVSGES